MKFTLTNSDLKKLSAQKEVTIAELLSLFYDLCQDAEAESGHSLEQMALGNNEALLRRLPWASRLLVKINSQLEVPASLGIVAKKLQQNAERLSDGIASLEKLRDKNSQMIRTEAELDKQLEQLTEEQRQKEALEIRISQKEERLRCSKDTQLPDLEKQLKDTEMLIASTEQELRDKEKTFTDHKIRLEELNRALEAVNASCAAAADEITENQLTVDTKEQKLTALQQTLTEQTARAQDLDTELNQLSEKLKALEQEVRQMDGETKRQMLEEAVAEQEQQRADLTERQKQLEEAQRQASSTAQQIDQAVQEYQLKQTEIAALQEKLQHRKNLRDSLHETEIAVRAELGSQFPDELNRISQRLQMLSTALNAYRSDRQRLSEHLPGDGSESDNLDSAVRTLNNLCNSYYKNYEKLLEEFEKNQI